nr:hypothetical protein BaRGS_026725 [Batillaria attramentaria]
MITARRQIQTSVLVLISCPAFMGNTTQIHRSTAMIITRQPEVLPKPLPNPLRYFGCTLSTKELFQGQHPVENAMGKLKGTMEM